MIHIRSRFVYAVVCYILAVTIMFVGIPSVLSLTYKKTKAVRVVNPVGRGEQLTKDNLEEITVGNLNLPEDILHSLEDTVGRYVTVDLVAGDWVFVSKISQIPLDGSFLNGEQLPEGSTAVSINVFVLEGSIEKKFQSRDIIKLYSYTNHLTEVPELQFVRVLTVLEGKDQSTLTILATDKQMQKVNAIKNEGKIYATLISRGNEALAADLIKQQQNYLYPDKK